jgi:hypothetical protein
LYEITVSLPLATTAHPLVVEAVNKEIVREAFPELTQDQVTTLVRAAASLYTEKPMRLFTLGEKVVKMRYYT